MSFDYACAQTSSDAGYRERYVLGEGTAPLERRIDLPASHVRAMPRGVALRIHALVTRLLRLTAHLLYLFPLLLVAKVAFFLQGNALGDYITVGFVVLVVVFFAFFALTVLLHSIVGPRSQRGGRMRLVFAPPPADDLERIVASVAPNAATRARGRVEAGLGPGEPVLVEEWSHGEELARFVEARSFAIVPDEDDAMPCIVEIAAAPVLLARYSEDETAPALTVAGGLEGRAREPATRSRCVLRQGQRVAVVARGSLPSRVEDARLLALVAKDGAAPYRGAESPGIVVRSTPEEPVVIQLLD